MKGVAFGSIPEPLTFDLQHTLNDIKENKQKTIFFNIPQRLSPLPSNFRWFQFLLVEVLETALSHSAVKFVERVIAYGPNVVFVVSAA